MDFVIFSCIQMTHVNCLYIICSCVNGPILYEQNFDTDKSRQKFYHSLIEHQKISNIPEFRCEML